MIDLAGWVGSAMLISAYWQNSSGKLEAISVKYQLFNLIGSLLLVINTFHYGAYPSGVVNIIWVGIGTRFLFKRLRRTETMNRD